MNEPAGNLNPFASLLRRIITGICYKPSQFEAKEVHTSSGKIVFYVRVHADDYGLVTGGKGAPVIVAIQTIFRHIAKRFGGAIHIYVDKFGEQNAMAPLFKSIDAWDKNDEAIKLVTDALELAGHKAKCTAEDFADNTLITCKTNAPGELLESLYIVMQAWGKSQGRRIELVPTDKVQAA